MLFFSKFTTCLVLFCPEILATFPNFKIAKLDSTLKSLLLVFLRCGQWCSCSSSSVWTFLPVELPCYTQILLSSSVFLLSLRQVVSISPHKVVLTSVEPSKSTKLPRSNIFHGSNFNYYPRLPFIWLIRLEPTTKLVRPIPHTRSIKMP